MHDETKGAALVFESAGASDRGRLRAANEDAFGLCHDVYVVCDGMGGAAGGEVASHMTRDAILDQLCKNAAGWAKKQSEAQGMDQLLPEAITQANTAVFARGQEDASLHGMGTTLVVLVFEQKHAWLAHVGDSRGYRLRQGTLERLTRDHSLVDEQVRLGQLTPEEAEHSPLRNVITRAIGSHKTVMPEVESLAVESGDVFLLCSDGLPREVSDEHIAVMLRDASSAENACHALIDAANANGGRDNITCVVVRAR